MKAVILLEGDQFYCGEFNTYGVCYYKNYLEKYDIIKVENMALQIIDWKKHYGIFYINCIFIDFLKPEKNFDICNNPDYSVTPGKAIPIWFGKGCRRKISFLIE
jgi:hypothetical protein